MDKITVLAFFTYFLYFGIQLLKAQECPEEMPEKEEVTNIEQGG